jgi:hypothetical protein
VAVAAPLPGFAPSPWTVVDLQWFASLTEALANDAWLAAVAPDLRDGSCRVVATEVVLRGRAYLDARWREGGQRLKMMSFGRRNPALTPEEFSARWRSEAGRLGAEQIPDAVRGLAYVQNHPVPLDGQEWPLDAVNEVYVEGLDQLRRREAWFAERRAATLRSDAQLLDQLDAHAGQRRPRCGGWSSGKNPVSVPSVARATARSRSNLALWWLSSARISAMPMTARAEMSNDSGSTP